MPVDLTQVLADVTRALAEDVGSGDVSAGLLADDVSVNADIISREPMVFCGKPWVEATFHTIDAEIVFEWFVDDGDRLDKPTTLCRIEGAAKSILTAERTALNFLQTLSATASQTYEYVSHLNGTTCQLLDTRKTIPGLRYAQKYAVTCGGGKNHRLGLYDAFLIKENHIKACGSITQAIAHARRNHPLLVEVEVESLQELQEALHAKPDRILLDNFSLDMLQQAVKMNTPKQCDLEASGGVDLSTLKKIAATGVDYISVGAITKSVRAIDLSLLIRDIIP